MQAVMFLLVKKWVFPDQEFIFLEPLAQVLTHQIQPTMYQDVRSLIKCLLRKKEQIPEMCLEKRNLLRGQHQQSFAYRRSANHLGAYPQLHGTCTFLFSRQTRSLNSPAFLLYCNFVCVALSFFKKPKLKCINI